MAVDAFNIAHFENDVRGQYGSVLTGEEGNTRLAWLGISQSANKTLYYHKITSWPCGHRDKLKVLFLCETNRPKLLDSQQNTSTTAYYMTQQISRLETLQPVYVAGSSQSSLQSIFKSPYLQQYIIQQTPCGKVTSTFSAFAIIVRRTAVNSDLVWYYSASLLGNQLSSCCSLTFSLFQLNTRQTLQNCWWATLPCRL